MACAYVGAATNQNPKPANLPCQLLLYPRYHLDHSSLLARYPLAQVSLKWHAVATWCIHSCRQCVWCYVFSVLAIICLQQSCEMGWCLHAVSHPLLGGRERNPRAISPLKYVVCKIKNMLQFVCHSNVVTGDAGLAHFCVIWQQRSAFQNLSAAHHNATYTW